jgi:hypothetical protein
MTQMFTDEAEGNKIAWAFCGPLRDLRFHEIAGTNQT